MVFLQKSFKPSLTTQNIYVNEIISSKSQSKFSDFYNSYPDGGVYNSHRELNLIGRGNAGINLDEVVSNKSYLEQEMTKKNGLVYSFSRTLFTLESEFDEHIVQEDLKESDFPANSLTYISSICYGRIGLLMVESDYSVNNIKKVINNIFEGDKEPLSSVETECLNELEAYFIYFDNSYQMQVIRGKRNAIKAYKVYKDNTKIKGTAIYPFQFSVIDYFSPGETSLIFKLTIL